MRRSIIFARRIQAGKAAAPIGWDGVNDFSAWYVKNVSATSQKAILRLFYKNAIDRSSGRMHGLIMEIEGTNGKEMWGFRGANISVYLPAGATLTGSQVNVGLHVEVQGGDTITGDWFGAYIYSAPGATPSGDSCVLRLEALAAADAGNKTWLEFIGGKGERAMSFGPLATQTAWGYTGTLTEGVGGWIKVCVGPNHDRYIQLYDTK